ALMAYTNNSQNVDSGNFCVCCLPPLEMMDEERRLRLPITPERFSNPLCTRSGICAVIVVGVIQCAILGYLKDLGNEVIQNTLPYILNRFKVSSSKHDFPRPMINLDFKEVVK
ncbi:18475_t:CDS:2, partial [Acaulospora morrowiae]